MNRPRFTADCRETKGRTRSFTEENCAVDQKADQGQGGLGGGAARAALEKLKEVREEPGGHTPPISRAIEDGAQAS